MLAWVLSSCLAQRKFQDPELSLNTDELYRFEHNEDSASLAQLPLDEFFADSLLHHYILQGFEKNYDVRIALQSILAAEAYRKQGKAAFYPTLSVGPNANWQQFSSNTAFGEGGFNMNQFDLTANVSWEADIWGKISSQNKAFQASYLQSISAKQAVMTQLVSQISQAYFELLALDEQLEITRRTIENREKSLKVIKALKASGINNTTEVAVKQTAAQLYDAQEIESDLTGRIQLAENRLSILLGQAPQKIQRGKLSQQSFSNDLTTGVPLAMISNRPDLKAAEQGLIQAFQLTNKARAEMYPSLTLTAGLGLMSNDISKVLLSNSFYHNLMAGLSQPIFNGRQLKTAHEVAKTKEEEALLNFEKSILVASQEVNDAMVNYETAGDRIESKMKSYEAYRIATKQSERLLENGMINYLEVLTAKENELSTELTLVDLRREQLASVVNLYVALGGGWSND